MHPHYHEGREPTFMGAPARPRPILQRYYAYNVPINFAGLSVLLLPKAVVVALYKPLSTCLLLPFHLIIIAFTSSSTSNHYQ